jgi:hypothetical protein
MVGTGKVYNVKNAVTTEVINKLISRWPASEIVQVFKARVEREGMICLHNGQPSFQQGEDGVDEAKQDRIFVDLMRRGRW